MNLNNTTAKPWYKEPWPWFLMSGPFIVVLAGFVTFYLAIQSDDGLVTDDYYKEGLAINQSLARDDTARNMQLSANVMTKENQLRVIFAPSANLPQEVLLKIVHPTQAGFDLDVPLNMEAPGIFNATLPKALKGRWHLILEDSQQTWRLQGDWLPSTPDMLVLQPPNK